jgi:valyl-tRNA synthetase
MSNANDVGQAAGEPLPKTYDPQSVEGRIYALWEDGGYFRPEAQPGGEPFTIVIPPPNVTDKLHLGHALNNTIQDILVRRRRMQGRKALWLPGTDHAGIATQAVVERRTFEEEKKTRHDLGRDEMVRRIWAWKKRSGDLILEQLRRIGSSCDWSRSRFTLDETCARAVRTVFFRMFKDGLIYRGLRLVNWDTHLQTAVADDEVYHETVKGHMWHIRYPVAGEPGRFVVVATTRPETMLGDTAVAVHPADERYQDIVGKTVVLPLADREIPVIADGLLVDPKFGSGCVKVTPAHDPNDYETGLRHGLEMINILMPDGKINSNGGRYAGLDRFAARKRIVADLEGLGLMERIEDYQTEVGHSDRSKTPIEPYLSEQWFVQMGGMAEKAMAAVTCDPPRVRFHPDRYARTYLDWLGKKRDWCISRQLWWGHQIPVWKGPAAAFTWAKPEVDGPPVTCTIEGAQVAAFARQEDDARVVYACVPPDHEAAERALAAAGFTQDPDVLDTWFSSALWPFSTLGWPRETADLKAFYPTDVLVTAREIITLWVARMVMMGLYNQPRGADMAPREQVPFHDVYIHAMIQDGDGRPMKKSLGNGVDPLDIIATHGTDALRFTLAWMTTETQDVRLPVVKDAASGRNTSPKFDMGRNFCNKLWNAVRFALMNLQGASGAKFDAGQMRLEDRWILSRLTQTIAAADAALDGFHFQAAISTLYAFFWDDLCDWYLEAVKPRMADPAARAVPQRVLAFVLDQTLRLLHPFLPFITEAAWEGLAATVPDRGLPGLAEAPPAERVIVAKWPEASKEIESDRYQSEEKRFRWAQAIVRAARNIRAKVGVAPAARPTLIVKTNDNQKALLDTPGLVDLIKSLAELGDLQYGEGVEKPAGAASDIVSSAVGGPFLEGGNIGRTIDTTFEGVEVYMPLEGVIDLDRERRRVSDSLDKQRAYLATIEKKLGNANFAGRAPAEVVQRERDRADEVRAAIAALEKHLAELGA